MPSHGTLPINTQLATLTRRLCAMLYDSIIILTLLFVSTSILMIFTNGQAIKPSFAFYGHCLLVTFFYLGGSWLRLGQTIGMQAWRLSIVNEQTTKLTLKQVSIRFCVALVSLACCGIGFLWMLFNKDKCTWHDKASKTFIIYKGKR